LLASLLYLALRRLIELVLLRCRSEQFKELEIVVLRHELEILRRRVGRPVLRRADRALLAAASRLRPRRRWTAFFVTPETLARWHHQLVAHRWTRPAGDRAALASPARSASSYGARRARTRAGATGGSPASSPGSGSRYRRRPCASSCTTPGSARPDGEVDCPGASSSAVRRRPASPATSSPSKPSPCGESTRVGA